MNKYRTCKERSALRHTNLSSDAYESTIAKSLRHTDLSSDVYESTIAKSHLSLQVRMFICNDCPKLRMVLFPQKNT